MKKIKLTQGKYALVDNEDYEYLSKFNWYAKFNGYTWYAATNIPKTFESKRKNIKMHRMIMGDPKGMEIDHVNHDGLDNQKKNLKICTHAENMQNQKILRKSNTIGLRGVYFDKRNQTKKWFAKIQRGGTQISLGTFYTKEEASEAYNKKSLELFGSSAIINV